MDAWNKKKDMVEVIFTTCIPFRDKYKLTDLQTLTIARGDMKPAQILEIGKTIENK
jgi:hypothetical protein